MPFYAEPSKEQIEEVLKMMPSLPGLDLSDYASCITVIPGSQKIPGTQKEYRNTWTLYFDVAARVLMARRWHYEQGEGKKDGAQYTVVEVVPGAAGSPNDERFYLVHVTLDSPVLGPAHGYATADISGNGARADRTNPVENAETSAYGRALGLSWGFGVLPGDGAVASAEEMKIAAERKGAAVEPPRRSTKKTTKKEAAPDEAPAGEFEEQDGDDASQMVEQARQAAVEKLKETAKEAFGEDDMAARLAAAYCKLTEKEEAPDPDDWSMEEVARLSKMLKKHIKDNKAKGDKGAGADA